MRKQLRTMHFFSFYLLSAIDFEDDVIFFFNILYRHVHESNSFSFSLFIHFFSLRRLVAFLRVQFYISFSFFDGSRFNVSREAIIIIISIIIIMTVSPGTCKTVIMTPPYLLISVTIVLVRRIEVRNNHREIN